MLVLFYGFLQLWIDLNEVKKLKNYINVLSFFEDIRKDMISVNLPNIPDQFDNCNIKMKHAVWTE